MKVFGWNGGFNGGFNGMPLYSRIDDERLEGMVNHDSYEVYVNEDYVGNKNLITQGEEISDIDKHLRLEGFHDYDEDVIGNHVAIKTDDLEEAKRIKENLEVYLKIR
jgi:hypothetical protein